MSRPELSETLTELIGALDAGTGDETGGPTVVEAVVEAPMEVSFATGGDDDLRFYASPTRSRLVTGMMAPVHRVSITAVRVEVEP